MIKFTLLCTILLFGCTMVWSQKNDNGLRHTSANRWDNDYSIEVYYTGSEYHFKNVPDAPYNPFVYVPGTDTKLFGTYGFGVAFSKTLTPKARIEISPSFYGADNQSQYSYSSGISYSQQRTYDLHAFSIPVNYVSYFKIPKRRVSWYWMATIEYTSQNLTIHDFDYQNSTVSVQNSRYTARSVGLLAGIGIDFKINKTWYLFYDTQAGLTINDASLLGGGRLGVRVNFFKK